MSRNNSMNIDSISPWWHCHTVILILICFFGVMLSQNGSLKISRGRKNSKDHWVSKLFLLIFLINCFVTKNITLGIKFRMIVAMSTMTKWSYRSKCYFCSLTIKFSCFYLWVSPSSDHRNHKYFLLKIILLELKVNIMNNKTLY